MSRNYVYVVSEPQSRIPAHADWEYEDCLGVDITDGMFRASRIIDGVRMYPYVELPAFMAMVYGYQMRTYVHLDEAAQEETP